jgi:tRNA(fMet)-specific endonuclease VapC
VIYLLDSNVWIALMRGSSAVLAARYKAMAPTADLRVCAVVVAELWYGAARSAKPAANRASVDALIAPFPGLPYDNAAAEYFVSVRRHVESIGQMIGPYDLQIAAIALANR